MTFTWEERDEDLWSLLDADGRLVGEIYPRGDGYRWHCKVSDWRQMEPTLNQAKVNLLAQAMKEAARHPATESST